MKIHYFINKEKSQINQKLDDSFLIEIVENFYSKFIWIAYYTKNYYVILKLANYHDNSYTVSAPVGNFDMMQTTIITIDKNNKEEIKNINNFLKINTLIFKELEYKVPTHDDFGDIYNLNKYYSYIWGTSTPFVKKFIELNSPKLKMINTDLSYLSRLLSDVIMHCGTTLESHNCKSIAITNLFSLFWFRFEKNLKIIVNNDVKKQHPTVNLMAGFIDCLSSIKQINLIDDFEENYLNINYKDFDLIFTQLFEIMGDVKHDFNFQYKIVSLKSLLYVVLAYILSIYCIYSWFGIDSIKIFINLFNIQILQKPFDINDCMQYIEYIIGNSFLYDDKMIIELIREFHKNIFNVPSNTY